MARSDRRGILVVEDDTDLRRLFGLMLSAANFDVFEAADADAGLRMLADPRQSTWCLPTSAFPAWEASS